MGVVHEFAQRLLGREAYGSGGLALCLSGELCRYDMNSIGNSSDTCWRRGWVRGRVGALGGGAGHGGGEDLDQSVLEPVEVNLETTAQA